MNNLTYNLKILISYSNSDKQIANKLTLLLSKNNCIVYSYNDIDNNLAKCDLFIPILTNNYVNSLYSKIELADAIKESTNNGLYILPLVVDNNYDVDTSSLMLVSVNQLISFNTTGDNTKLINAIDNYRYKINIYKIQNLAEDYISLGNDELACKTILSLIEYHNSNYRMNKSSFTFHSLMDSINKYFVISNVDWVYLNSRKDRYFISLKEIILDAVNSYLEFDYDYSPETMIKIIHYTYWALYEYTYNNYDTDPNCSDRYVNLQLEIIRKHPYLKDCSKYLITTGEYVKKKINDSSSNIENKDIHTAIADYLYKSNELFNVLTKQHNQPLEFYSCLKMSYERLKDYCAVIKDTKTGNLAMEKVLEIDSLINNIEVNENKSLESKGLKAILGIKEQNQGEYDIFISHKSKDTELASKVYKFLKSNMIEPFFDKECLPELGKSEYEDAILGALNNSKHFVIILSNLEYLNSGWVKEEIDTFAQELREGRKDGNLLFLVTSDVMDEIIRTNKECLPLKYRKFEIMQMHEYRDKILPYIR